MIQGNIRVDSSVMAIRQARDASNHTGNESFDGEISWVFVFERLLSTHETTQVLAYLKEKDKIKYAVNSRRFAN